MSLQHYGIKTTAVECKLQTLLLELNIQCTFLTPVFQIYFFLSDSMNKKFPSNTDPGMS